MDGQNHSLTLTEILDELPKNNFDVTPKTKAWLSEVGLELSFRSPKYLRLNIPISVLIKNIFDRQFWI